MASCVADAAIAFRAMRGKRAKEFQPELLEGLRIGLPRRFFFDRLEPLVRQRVMAAAKLAESAGARIVEVDPGDGEDLNDAGRVIQLAEAAAVFEPYANRREDFGADVLALFDQGRMLPATDYLNAQRARRRLADEFDRVWAECDALLVPATPMVAPKIGQTTVEFAEGPEDVRMAGTRLTRPINVLGWPTVSLPCGNTPEGLPIGLQWMGPPGSDARTLSQAAALESILK
jgi:aspartyl-tRNA(Asn)/glutamyl-tRNA(Gln) amidotransferase subunit A